MIHSDYNYVTKHPLLPPQLHSSLLKHRNTEIVTTTKTFMSFVLTSPHLHFNSIELSQNEHWDGKVPQLKSIEDPART